MGIFFQKNKAEKMIVGIHGLGNKPPKAMLTQWWRRSIAEGLQRIGVPGEEILLEMVYWADVLYPQPLDPDMRDKENPLYIREPYIPGKKGIESIRNTIKVKILKYIDEQLDKIFISRTGQLNYTNVTDQIIHRYFGDLEKYYSADYAIRETIRSRLADVLERHKGKQILLISHSMGSIIAYDVLSRLNAQYEIPVFITIGSPLGLPVIFSKIQQDLNNDNGNKNLLIAPECITNYWYNLSDPEDLVALDHTLSDDYAANSHGIVATDMQVYNDYRNDNERNPHKVYGYLRTPELAGIIQEFLKKDEFPWIFEKYQSMKQWICHQMQKITAPGREHES